MYLLSLRLARNHVTGESLGDTLFYSLVDIGHPIMGFRGVRWKKKKRNKVVQLAHFKAIFGKASDSDAFALTILLHTAAW